MNKNRLEAFSYDRHHMMHTVKQVNGKTIYANLHLLFWLSLIFFATAFMLP